MAGLCGLWNDRLSSGLLMQTREVLIGEIVTFEPVKAFETPPLVSTSFCFLGIHLFAPRASASSGQRAVTRPAWNLLTSV